MQGWWVGRTTVPSSYGILSIYIYVLRQCQHLHLLLTAITASAPTSYNKLSICSIVLWHFQHLHLLPTANAASASASVRKYSICTNVLRHSQHMHLLLSANTASAPTSYGILSICIYATLQLQYFFYVPEFVNLKILRAFPLTNRNASYMRFRHSLSSARAKPARIHTAVNKPISYPTL